MSKRQPDWKMGGITNPALEEYLYQLSPESSDALREMERVAAERHIQIIGPLVGRFLCQLATLAQAKTVFEMGSAIGYSTIWWAMAVGEGGRVIYTDGDRRKADEARRYFERAGVAGRIEIRTGDALEILSEERKQFDIVFIDIDKSDYPRAFRMGSSRVRSGGLLVADNALWSAKVVDPAFAKDPSTQGVLEFNRALYSSPDFFSTILPLRDGVAVALKK